MELEQAIQAAMEAGIPEEQARLVVEAAAPHLDPHRATCDRYWETLEQRAVLAEAEARHHCVKRVAAETEVERAEAEVERNRKTAMHWFELYEANRLLADRLAEALRRHNCRCGVCVGPVLAAWKEARHESQEQLAIEAETQG